MTESSRQRVAVDTGPGPGGVRATAAVSGELVVLLASPAPVDVDGASWPVGDGVLRRRPTAGSGTTTDDWRTP